LILGLEVCCCACLAMVSFSPWMDCFLCSLCVLRSQITLWSADPQLSFPFCDWLWREGSGLMRVREWGCWQILTSSCIQEAKWYASTLLDEWLCQGCSGGHLRCCVLLWCQWWIQVFSSLDVWVLQY
jgi:hypothetical protein